MLHTSSTSASSHLPSHWRQGFLLFLSLCLVACTSGGEASGAATEPSGKERQIEETTGAAAQPKESRAAAAIEAPAAQRAEGERAAGIRTVFKGELREAGEALLVGDTFVFDEGQLLRTFLQAGWASGEERVEARLTLRGKAGETLGPGSYRLIADAHDYAAEELSATLVLLGGVASLPALLHSSAGILHLRHLEIQDEEVVGLELDFEGSFFDGGVEAHEPAPESQPLSGSIRFP